MFEWLPWTKTKPLQPQIKFGRYSDAHKNDYQINFWNSATKLFGEKKYLEAYEKFFQYINDESESNVSFENTGSKIVFEIQQGSKIITGEADENHCRAETVVATFNSLDVVVMRKLLEFNYQLKYSRYSINDKQIKLSFDSSTIDGSPEKLYYALREVATHSDRQDDLLINEFETLSQFDNSFISDLKKEEKEVKHRYLKVWINSAFNLIDKLDSNQNDHVISQILLATAFKIDYLIVPQGKLMNEIEKIQHISFVPDGTNKIEKNDSIKQIFKKILNVPKEQIFEELYATKATFGVTQPISHEYLSKFLNEESPKSAYIKNQQQYQIHLFVQEYICQYIMFFWGVNPPTKDLLHLAVRLINENYFNELGFKPALYEPMKEELNKKELLAIIQSIEKRAKLNYSNFKLDYSVLKFESIPFFVESVFDLIKTLNYD